MAEESASPRVLERKLATILSADVAEYSRLMAEDEEQTLRTFRAHAEIFRSLVTLHRGRVFNTAGDAILAEFGSAVEAVRCATEIQAALRTRNDQLPASRQVRFRIGVNLGDVMVQDEDLLGDGVNVAARLQSAAEPGGICISGSVYDQIRNKLSLSFKPLGERSYKNIPQAVRTFSIAEAEGPGAPSAESIRRWLLGERARWAIAVVLPLAVAGGYWAVAQNHRGKLDEARALAEANRPMAGRGVEAAGEQRAVPEARRRAETERAEGGRNRTEPPVQVVAVPPGPQRPLANAPAADRGTDGLYAGAICYGAAAADPPRCFRAQAMLNRGRIAGQWPGRDPGVTMFLVGEVSASGEAKIHMHAEKSDGTRISAIDLAGTLKDGRLDATGSFRNGRTASINWRRAVTGSR